jgi:hypothetical protein
VVEKCKIVVATSIRRETSLEKCEKFCGISVRIICGEISQTKITDINKLKIKRKAETSCNLSLVLRSFVLRFNAPCQFTSLLYLRSFIFS